MNFFLALLLTTAPPFSSRSNTVGAPFCVNVPGNQSCINADGTGTGVFAQAELWKTDGGTVTPVGPRSLTLGSATSCIGNECGNLMIIGGTTPAITAQINYPDGGGFVYEDWVAHDNEVELFNYASVVGTGVQTPLVLELGGPDLATALAWKFQQYILVDQVYSYTSARPMFNYDVATNATHIQAYHNGSASAAISIQDTYPSATGGCGLYQSADGQAANEWRCTGIISADGGEPLATVSALRSYAIVSGVTTTNALGVTVQGGFRAPSAGVPSGFFFRVGTAGAGGANVTISLYDATTSASKGTATFACTATGDQSMAVTSPTAWAANDTMELRIDPSACTVTGPIGTPSATVQWQ